MELTPDQAERLFRSFEQVTNLVEQQKKYFEKLERQDSRIDQQEEQHQENVARLAAISDAVGLSDREARASRQQAQSSLRLLEKAVKEMKENLGGRIARLEAPVRQALARRHARRRLWLRVSGFASATAAILWLVLEPARTVLIEWVMGHWLPPHK